ncbi:MAG: hypothetical protein LBI48_04455 [Burkholderiaceae bacterium]|jgi:hypothetical protein|nr:hypothetical protein [Burkholderiaceae bacterium]
MTLLAQFTGRIAAQPLMRVRPDAHGRYVPVLCLELTAEGTVPAGLHVEQPFPLNQHAQCSAAAHRFKPGQRVTVQAPIEALELVVRQREREGLA